MTTLSFEALWRDRGATAGLRNLAAGTKAARVSYDDLRAATVRAAGAMKKAQLNIADATRAVAVQEARLKEARASGTAKASQILAIEDRLALARRREADATEAAKRASVDLTRANEREHRASSKLSLASAAGMTAFRGLGSASVFAGRGLVSAGRGLAVVGGGLVSAGVAAAKLGVGVGVAAGFLGVKAVNAASKFDQSMRQVGVTSGTTGQGLKDLTKLALDMGAKTSFSAQGASDAMLALAKGGMSAAQIKAGALQSTLTLASAGGLQLGDAANYMVSGLTAFGLKASQAGQVAAALAGGANASTASVESMGLALSQVGSGARTAGLSLQDTTAAIAAFANAGIHGSDAGTSLKTFLTRLVPTTKAATTEMRALGLITQQNGQLTRKESALLTVARTKQIAADDAVRIAELRLAAVRSSKNASAASIAAAESSLAQARTRQAAANALVGASARHMGNAFFDAHGKIKSLAEVAAVLQKALHGQTREQKIATLTTIFGTDASRAAAILATEGVKGIAKYVKATSDQSAAQALAKNATLGYAGALERFKGSVETAGIQVGTRLLPVLSKLLDWMSGKALPALSQLGPAFTVLGSSLSTLGHTVMTVFKSFAQSAGLGKGSFKDFADFLSTHQEDITRGIISGAKAFIAFGRVVAQIASGGLRAFGALSDGLQREMVFVTDALGSVVHGAAAAFGWIPGIGPKLLAADAKFTIFAARARGSMYHTGDAARGLADKIDNGIIPAFDKAGIGLDAYGKKATTSAHAQDALARAGIAHRKVLDAALASVKAYGKGLDTNTAAGVVNRRALQNLIISSQTYISRLIATHASSARVTQATKDARAEFIRVAEKMGVARGVADKLAAAYFHIPTKSSHKHTQPGMLKAIENVKELDRRIAGIKDKSVRLDLTFRANATKGLLGFMKNVPGSQASGFYQSLSTTFRAKGGAIQNVSGYGSKGKDTELVVTAVGEHVWTDKEVDAVGGHETMYRMRRDARRGAFKGYADGGAVQRNLTIDTHSNAVPSSVNRFGPAGLAGASAVGGDALRSLGSIGQKAINAAIAASLSAPGGLAPGGAGGGRGLVRYHGGTFTALFRNNLIRAENAAGVHPRIYQGGFRPRTSYSGTTHMGDAVDYPQIPSLLRAFRHLVGAMWMRGPAQGFIYHMHGVPAPGRGYGSASARWQYQDYLRGGNGLASGGMAMRAGLYPLAERGPERVLTTGDSRNFDNLVSVMRRSGGGAVNNYYVTLNAPNYIGSRAELKQTLVEMARRNELAVITGR